MGPVCAGCQVGGQAHHSAVTANGLPLPDWLPGPAIHLPALAERETLSFGSRIRSTDLPGFGNQKKLCVNFWKTNCHFVLKLLRQAIFMVNVSWNLSRVFIHSFNRYLPKCSLSINYTPGTVLNARNTKVDKMGLLPALTGKASRSFKLHTGSNNSF